MVIEYGQDRRHSFQIIFIMQYQQIVQKLTAIVGEKHVLTEFEDRYCYSFDSTFINAMPDVVLQPGSRDEIAAVCRLAYSHGIPVVTRGAATGLSGGAGQQSQFSADQHNQAQERQELSRIFSHMRMLRNEGGDVARDMHNEGMQAILADRGLHIVA